MPKDLLKLILKYYYKAADEFDKSISHTSYRFDNIDTRLIRPKIRNFKGWMSAFGKDKIIRGDEKIWRFQLLNNEYPQHANIYLGVINETYLSWTDITKTKLPSGFSVWTYHSAWRCKDNDIITMELDMTGYNGVLSFKINDMDYKIVQGSLSILNTYCMGVSMYECGEIQLL